LEPIPLTRISQFNEKGWKRGAILEQRRRPTLKLQSRFARSQAVAIKLNITSQHRRSMSAQRHKPIDFAAEGLRLALMSIATAGLIEFKWRPISPQ
jgi:hypothetical protein